MRRFLAALILCVMAVPAMARQHPNVSRTIICMDRGLDCLMQQSAIAAPHGWSVRRPAVSEPMGTRMLGPAFSVSGIITVVTAAGPIHIAGDVADRFVGFIEDLVATGYKPRHVGCFSPTGHVPGSLHHSGRACDFDQWGWGKTAGPMYRVASLAARWGLRDGCSFRHADCGHIDTGERLRVFAHRRHHRRYASR